MQNRISIAPYRAARVAPVPRQHRQDRWTFSQAPADTGSVTRAAGAWVAFVPTARAWSHEVAEAPVGHARFQRLERLAELPGWVAEIECVG